MWSGNNSQAGGGSIDDPVFNFYKSNSKLTPEQMMWLNSHLTHHERAEIQNMASNSLNEINLTRGIPCALASVVGLYILKKKNMMNFTPITSGLVFGITPVVVAIITDGIFLRNHPSTLRVHERIKELYAQHSAKKELSIGGKEHGKLTYAQIREVHRNGRSIESLQKGSPYEEKLSGIEEGKQFGDKIDQTTQIKPNLSSYLGTDTSSDISFMSGTPRGFDEGNNERWK
ncbi:hypothetical protein Mgra_00001489 [Meloidogyne graminicola]|uniref:Uncharacterized protein n=1 Tax=Meloidogyne graminicola TaxID=189291 RepID=A0A8T0A1I5_9BILA|nr:hypothetical protein Mgra_00001489 [Meloidogyne graminicola]